MRKIVSALLMFVILLSFSACGLAGLMSNNKQNTTYTTPRTTKSSSSTSKPKPTTPKPTAAPTEPPSVDISGDSYEHNTYFDVIDQCSYQDSIGTTYIIHKILAKKDISASSTIIAYDKDKKVIGKSSDSIVLTKDSYNYFSYSFKNDISEASLEIACTCEPDSFLVGPRNAIEMVTYNKAGDELYITVKQTKSDIGTLPKYKVLYYKEDQLIGASSGYYGISSSGLSGIGSTDVISVPWFDFYHFQDFDSLECFFEP